MKKLGDEIRLTLPDEQWENDVMDYRKEFIEMGERLHGAGNLHESESYAQWLAGVRNNMDPATVRGGLVPATSYLGVRASDGTLVGMIQIRHALNDYLRRFGGHIGYSVRKGERRKGYAGEMLHLSLEKCREMGISRVLVTCDRENTASARTILSNGGMLEGEVREGAGVTQRYWIEV